MDSAMIELVILLLGAWLVLRFVGRLISGSPGRPSQSAEPGDHAGRPAQLRPRPGRDSAAVDLAEPDEEEDQQP